MNQVLVTGGAGFIGSHLVNYLINNGYDVTVVDDLSMGKINNLEINNSHIHFYKKNVCDYDFMHHLLLDNNFGYIFYFAAVASVAESINKPWYTHNVNQESVINILEFIRQHDIKIKRFLFTSSAAVYGDIKEFPKKETSHIDPLSPYAIDKYSSERYVINYNKLYGIPTVCTRFFNVYGPNQNPESPYSGVLSIMTNCLKHNKLFKLYGDGTQTRDFVYINDVIQALLLLGFHSSGSDVYNVATGHEVSLNKIIKIYQDISHVKLKCIQKSFRKGDIYKSVADISKICKLGYKPKWGMSKGLSSYWKYETNNSNT